MWKYTNGSAHRNSALAYDRCHRRTTRRGPRVVCSEHGLSTWHPTGCRENVWVARAGCKLLSKSVASGRPVRGRPRDRRASTPGISSRSRALARAGPSRRNHRRGRTVRRARRGTRTAHRRSTGVRTKTEQRRRNVRRSTVHVVAARTPRHRHGTTLRRWTTSRCTPRHIASVLLHIVVVGGIDAVTVRILYRRGRWGVSLRAHHLHVGCLAYKFPPRTTRQAAVVFCGERGPLGRRHLHRAWKRKRQ